jgi:hypothetical protein
MDRPDPVIAFQQAVDTASMPIFTKLMSLNDLLQQIEEAIDILLKGKTLTPEQLEELQAYVLQKLQQVSSDHDGVEEKVRSIFTKLSSAPTVPLNAQQALPPQQPLPEEVSSINSLVAPHSAALTSWAQRISNQKNAENAASLESPLINQQLPAAASAANLQLNQQVLQAPAEANLQLNQQLPAALPQANLQLNQQLPPVTAANSQLNQQLPGSAPVANAENVTRVTAFNSLPPPPENKQKGLVLRATNPPINARINTALEPLTQARSGVIPKPPPGPPPAYIRGLQQYGAPPGRTRSISPPKKRLSIGLNLNPIHPPNMTPEELRNAIQASDSYTLYNIPVIYPNKTLPITTDLTLNRGGNTIGLKNKNKVSGYKDLNLIRVGNNSAFTNPTQVHSGFLNSTAKMLTLYIQPGDNPLYPKKELQIFLTSFTIPGSATEVTKGISQTLDNVPIMIRDGELIGNARGGYSRKKKRFNRTHKQRKNTKSKASTKKGNKIKKVSKSKTRKTKS